MLSCGTGGLVGGDMGGLAGVVVVSSLLGSCLSCLSCLYSFISEWRTLYSEASLRMDLTWVTSSDASFTVSSFSGVLTYC